MKIPVLSAAAVLLSVVCAPAQTVRFETNLGNIDVILLPESAPNTVANFLRYVNRGAYKNSFFHRSVVKPTPFIIQGGGFVFDNNATRAISSDRPVVNEYKISNTRGTLAMAKLGSDPNSATNQWFFNLGNNSANLDNQNGGFTVFGRVANDEGLAIMDKIAAVPTYDRSDVNGAFTDIPLQNYKSGDNLSDANLVIVKSITDLDPTPSISQNGVISASNFGGFSSAAPGSYIEIYGFNLSGQTRSWADSDFSEGKAPTKIEDVSVTVGNRPAYVNFVSPTQINVQVPGDVPTGNVPVVVSYGNKTSAPATISVRPLAPGLLAPASFRVRDRQYIAAIHSATGAFVSNGTIPNVSAAPANPGETLILYGIGFGAVTPGDVAGKIASGFTSLNTPVEVRFGDILAEVRYAGLAPNLVGLYQFNVVVPAGVGNGDLPLRVSSGGSPISQTLFISVASPFN